MKKEIDPKIVYSVVAFLVVVVVIFAIRATGDRTVPASEIKAPAPPGGFPSRPGQSNVPAPE